MTELCSFLLFLFTPVLRRLLFDRLLTTFIIYELLLDCEVLGDDVRSETRYVLVLRLISTKYDTQNVVTKLQTNR